MPAPPPRPRSTLLAALALWFVFYSSFTLFTPPLLDDADSVHAEVAREMLLRHDYVTLYANGIRYLEKAPLLYWSMAASMRVSQFFDGGSPRALAAAARVPLALVVLALALLCEAFARRLTRSTWAGLYAALIVLSGFGLFIYSHLTLPDAAVCLWLTLALYAFWRTEQNGTEEIAAEEPSQPVITTTAAPAGTSTPVISTTAAPAGTSTPVISTGGALLRRSGEIPVFRPKLHTSPRASENLHFPLLFATACALNVLTKGLIGVVFPLGIVLAYLLLTRGVRGTLRRLRELHPAAAGLLFLAIAAPWHIAAGLANPTQGHPMPFAFVSGHWHVPLPTDGNVRGWFWFYFMNEHVLRYLNLRVPRDYDTVPLALFWGLCFVWLMPWSAFAFQAARWAVPVDTGRWRDQVRRHVLSEEQRGKLLLALGVVFVLLFFSLSTRQEYYVLPALPAAAILIGAYLARSDDAFAAAIPASNSDPMRSTAARPGVRTFGVFALAGAAVALMALFFLLRTPHPAPGVQLAQLLTQNPGEYALSMGHFLDLKTRALGLFHVPLGLLAAASLFGPSTAYRLRKRGRPHASTLALAAATFVFLLAADSALIIFSPTLSSAQLAEAIAPQVKPGDLVAIHGEYEAGSTLGFYLQRTDIHILEGRSANLWYGSFFPDAPRIFESRDSLAARWSGPQRIFLWQDLQDADREPFLPAGPVYVVASSEGKQILSNQPNR